jgi:sigma-B regulation protein RsbU (phosphoserine phosphatase)
MGMFKSALRMRLRQPGPLSSLLDDLNTVLLPLKSGSMFVTVACVRGSVGGSLEYAVAGHLPILRVGAATREVEEFTTPQIPIGMFPDYRFTSATLQCDRGDLLALITDGLTEVFDGRDEQFGMDAVKDILGRSADLPLAEVSRQIVTAARTHGTQLDDQTVLLIRRL